MTATSLEVSDVKLFIKFNLGYEKIFTVQRSLIDRQEHKATMLYAMLNSEIPTTLDDDGCYFLDMSPECWAIIGTGCTINCKSILAA